MNDIDSIPGPPTEDKSTHAFMEDLAKSEPRPSGGFSLASLFLLVTAAGVISLLARTIVVTKVEPTLVTVHAVIGGFIGGIVGALIGAQYPRPVSSIGLGWLAGTATGGVCAATAASGGSPWLFFVGAIALITLGIASRWVQRV